MGTSRELEEVERRIQSFEDEYGISTAQMFNDVNTGRMQETFDTNVWAMLDKMRTRIVAYLNKSAAKAKEESDGKQ